MAIVAAAIVSLMVSGHCSNVCNTCCPSASHTIDANGGCWSDTNELVCHVDTARCPAGTGTGRCPDVGLADISITQPAKDALPKTTGRVASVASSSSSLSAAAVSPAREVPVLAIDSFLGEGVPVWEDLVRTATAGNVAAVHNVGEHFRGRFQVKMPVDTRLNAGSVVRYLCPNHAFIGFPAPSPCDVVVFVYECPCKPNADVARLSQALALDGYTRTRCAPTVTNGRTSTSHQLTAFVKTIQPGDLEKIVLQDGADFVFFGLSHGGAIDCPTVPVIRQCEDETRGFCRWMPSGCEVDTCVRQGPSAGSGPACDASTCLQEELL
eukprot:TRINITY_DN26_c0_g1_i4.p1 TRINITY_DN26_c0_g1~~TRINITY_DN26_c0_g1_i4.p1  ORF type:complete len:348 (+),score=108.42 TRINITY_DN26_c0_g1_i4:75-1046(+)